MREYLEAEIFLFAIFFFKFCSKESHTNISIIIYQVARSSFLVSGCLDEGLNKQQATSNKQPGTNYKQVR
jgi:hypothetical protein